jgi:SAM-dependent methyltransferase
MAMASEKDPKAAVSRTLEPLPRPDPDAAPKRTIFDKRSGDHLVEPDANVAWMKSVYSTTEYWDEIKYGYRWSKDAPVKDYRLSGSIIEKLLLPFIPRQVNDALEIGPGGGRWTVELLRIARNLHLVDVSETVLRVCQERFRYYDNLTYHLTSGSSLEFIPDKSLDLIFSWGVLVHVQRDHIAGYVKEFARVLKPGGVAFIQHPAQGMNARLVRTQFHRTDMLQIAEEAGLEVSAQLMTGYNFDPDYYDGKRKFYLDCVSVLHPMAFR